jgi:hypothetical protein
LLSDLGELVEQTVAPPDADGLRGLVGRLARHRQSAERSAAVQAAGLRE